MEALVEGKKVQYNGNIENVTKPSRKAGRGWEDLGRSFMAIIAIKLRKKVNWGQLSIA